MIKSNKIDCSIDKNLVKTRVGKTEAWINIAELSFHDNCGNEYTFEDMLNLILDLSTKSEAVSNKVVEIYNTQNKTDSLIVKSQDLLSLKVSQLEREVEDLKKKTKYL